MADGAAIATGDADWAVDWAEAALRTLVLELALATAPAALVALVVGAGELLTVMAVVLGAFTLRAELRATLLDV